MLVLQEERFMDAFCALADVPIGDAKLEHILRVRKIPEEEWEEAKRIFEVLVRVMKATETQEIRDIPLEDILRCYTWQALFEDFFVREKAGDYFSIVNKNMEKFHTARKRRIL